MADKSERVFKVFQRVAASYNAANDRISFGLHRRWKEYAAAACLTDAPTQPRVLDIGCGTGDMMALFRRLRPSASITGIDFSPNMLDEAGKRFEGDKNLFLILGDAVSLPLECRSFDCVSISFALRNTEDYQKVISEAARTAKVGGRICCIDSFVPMNPLILPFYRLYFGLIMPLAGGGFSKFKEYRWLYSSTESFISADEVGELMRSCGLSNISKKKFMFGACVCICAKKTERHHVV